MLPCNISLHIYIIWYINILEVQAPFKEWWFLLDDKPLLERWWLDSQGIHTCMIPENFPTSPYTPDRNHQQFIKELFQFGGESGCRGYVPGVCLAFLDYHRWSIYTRWFNLWVNFDPWSKYQLTYQKKWKHNTMRLASFVLVVSRGDKWVSQRISCEDICSVLVVKIDIRMLLPLSINRSVNRMTMYTFSGRCLVTLTLPCYWKEEKKTRYTHRTLGTTAIVEFTFSDPGVKEPLKVKPSRTAFKILLQQAMTQWPNSHDHLRGCFAMGMFRESFQRLSPSQKMLKHDKTWDSSTMFHSWNFENLSVFNGRSSPLPMPRREFGEHL